MICATLVNTQTDSFLPVILLAQLGELNKTCHGNNKLIPGSFAIHRVTFPLLLM